MKQLILITHLLLCIIFCPAQANQYLKGNKHGLWKACDNGYCCERNYKDGVLHGITKCTENDRIILEEEYIDGILHGTIINYKYYARQNHKMITCYKDGKRNGSCLYYIDTILVSRINYVNDKEEGHAYRYSAGRKIEEIQHYSNGRPDSIWTIYNEKGKVRCQTWYQNGNFKSEKCFFETGKLKTLTEGESNGRKITEYFLSGKKSRETLIVMDGTIDKIVTIYNEQERKVRTDTILMVHEEHFVDDPPLVYPEPIDPERTYEMGTLETDPVFPGGNDKIKDYLNKNLNYPVMEKESEIQGKVYIEFIIEQDGSITNVKLKRAVSKGLDAEALRVVRAMPNWIPGKVAGKNVRVRYVIPVNFKFE